MLEILENMREPFTGSSGPMPQAGVAFKVRNPHAAQAPASPQVSSGSSLLPEALIHGHMSSFFK